jgi:hypothetical protein
MAGRTDYGKAGLGQADLRRFNRPTGGKRGNVVNTFAFD